MAVRMKDLGIDRLSVEDRLALVEEICDSVAVESEKTPLSEARREDLRRRLAAYRVNPKVGSTWESVSTRLQK
jgi:putative addiction module component (TIGR02574 family)